MARAFRNNGSVWLIRVLLCTLIVCSVASATFAAATPTPQPAKAPTPSATVTAQPNPSATKSATPLPLQKLTSLPPKFSPTPVPTQQQLPPTLAWLNQQQTTIVGCSDVGNTLKLLNASGGVVKTVSKITCQQPDWQGKMYASNACLNGTLDTAFLLCAANEWCAAGKCQVAPGICQDPDLPGKLFSQAALNVSLTATDPALTQFLESQIHMPSATMAILAGASVQHTLKDSCKDKQLLEAICTDTKIPPAGPKSPTNVIDTQYVWVTCPVGETCLDNLPAAGSTEKAAACQPIPPAGPKDLCDKVAGIQTDASQCEPDPCGQINPAFDFPNATVIASLSQSGAWHIDMCVESPEPFFNGHVKHLTCKNGAKFIDVTPCPAGTSCQKGQCSGNNAPEPGVIPPAVCSDLDAANPKSSCPGKFGDLCAAGFVQIGGLKTTPDKCKQEGVKQIFQSYCAGDVGAYDAKPELCGGANVCLTGESGAAQCAVALACQYTVDQAGTPTAPAQLGGVNKLGETFGHVDKCAGEFAVYPIQKDTTATLCYKYGAATSCPAGSKCEAGVCKSTVQIQCSDDPSAADPQNDIFVQGILQLSNGSGALPSQKDSCAPDGWHVDQFDCNAQSANGFSKTPDSPNACNLIICNYAPAAGQTLAACYATLCQNGACKKCIDWDPAHDPTKKSDVSSVYPGAHSDYCPDATHLKQITCDATGHAVFPDNLNVDCAPGTCKEGVCIPPLPTPTPTLPTPSVTPTPTISPSVLPTPSPSASATSQPASGDSCWNFADDNDKCTTDTCVNGAVAHTPIAVDDSDKCTTDSCDPATGVVTHVPIAFDDGNLCTQDSCDKINGAQNAALTPAQIDDNNPCTIDSCDPKLGKQNIPKVTDDNNACTIDSCDATTGQVKNVPTTTLPGCKSTLPNCPDGTPLGLLPLPFDSVATKFAAGATNLERLNPGPVVWRGELFSVVATGQFSIFSNFELWKYVSQTQTWQLLSTRPLLPETKSVHLTVFNDSLYLIEVVPNAEQTQICHHGFRLAGNQGSLQGAEALPAWDQCLNTQSVVMVTAALSDRLFVADTSATSYFVSAGNPALVTVVQGSGFSSAKVYAAAVENNTLVVFDLQMNVAEYNAAANTWSVPAASVPAPVGSGPWGLAIARVTLGGTAYDVVAISSQSVPNSVYRRAVGDVTAGWEKIGAGLKTEGNGQRALLGWNNRLFFATTVSQGVADYAGTLYEWNQQNSLWVEIAKFSGLIEAFIASNTQLFLPTDVSSHLYFLGCPGDAAAVCDEKNYKVREIDPGSGHAVNCALLDTLSAWGELWCWGVPTRNMFPYTTPNGTPQPIATFATPMVPQPISTALTNIKHFALGNWHGCAIYGAASTPTPGPSSSPTQQPTPANVSCWTKPGSTKSDVLPALGTHVFGKPNVAPSPPFDPYNPNATDPYGAITTEPMAALVDVAVGEGFTCAVDTAGKTFCWGTNHDGVLGTGSTKPFTTNVPVLATEAMPNAIHVVAGKNHACSWDNYGKVKCWGDTLMGQTGTYLPGPNNNGYPSNPGDPNPLSFYFDYPLGAFSVSGLDATKNTTCGFAAGFNLSCWGDNTSQQAGFPLYWWSKHLYYPKVFFLADNILGQTTDRHGALAHNFMYDTTSGASKEAVMCVATSAFIECRGAFPAQFQPNLLMSAGVPYLPTNAFTWPATGLLADFRGGGYESFCGADSTGKGFCFGLDPYGYNVAHDPYNAAILTTPQQLPIVPTTIQFCPAPKITITPPQ